MTHLLRSPSSSTSRILLATYLFISKEELKKLNNIDEDSLFPGQVLQLIKFKLIRMFSITNCSSLSSQGTLRTKQRHLLNSLKKRALGSD